MRLSLPFAAILIWSVSSSSAHFAEAQASNSAPANVVRLDGGASGRMESVFFPPKAGAPFTLTLVTEWSRPLGNGGTFTLANKRRIMRDQAGRIYQERWMLVPKGGKIASYMDLIQITDPRRHTWLNCEVQNKTCSLMKYSLTTKADYPPALLTPGRLSNGTGYRQQEDLGLSSANGVETHGYRETTTIETGAMGNDQPMVTTREFWYSPELAFNLVSIVETPKPASRALLPRISLPLSQSPAYFNTPEGYKVIDRTKD